jgi:hypothetical protein
MRLDKQHKKRFCTLMQKRDKAEIFDSITNYELRLSRFKAHEIASARELTLNFS